MDKRTTSVPGSMQWLPWDFTMWLKLELGIDFLLIEFFYLTFSGHIWPQASIPSGIQTAGIVGASGTPKQFYSGLELANTMWPELIITSISSHFSSDFFLPFQPRLLPHCPLNHRFCFCSAWHGIWAQYLALYFTHGIRRNILIHRLNLESWL